MKKITVLIPAIFIIARLYSQSYEIDFTGIGDTTFVDSVYIKNLNQGTALIIKGDDVLKLNIPTSINTNTSDINSLKVYPNPMKEHTEIQFISTNSNNVLVAIYDISGKSVLQSNKFLQPGVHKYKVSGLNQGLYIIRVNEQNFCYNAKLISQSSSNYEVEMVYVSSNSLQLENTQIEQLKSTSSTRNMDYVYGDTLKFTAITGDYGAVVTDIPSESKTIEFNFKACVDADSNKYHIVMVGSQLWMAENLKTTKYRNSDVIGTTNPVTLNIISESNPKYQWAYEGNENYIVTNGRLYTWYAAADSRNICPVSWHLPTDLEWNVLIDYMTNNGYGYGGSGTDIAKSLSSISEWTSSSSVGVPGNDLLTNNTSGFKAFPSGCHVVVGLSSDIGILSYMWSSSDDSSSPSAKCMLLSHNVDSVRIVYNMKGNGFSIRCVKD